MLLSFEPAEVPAWIETECQVLAMAYEKAYWPSVP
jgi:hypothetical protein